MAMVTTCPHCTTSFNVEPEVLLARNGRVRCGKCKQVFDGLLSAKTLDEFHAAAAPAPLPPPAYWPALPPAPDTPIPPMPLEVAAAASPAYLAADPAQFVGPLPKAAMEPAAALKPPATRMVYKPPGPEHDEDDAGFNAAAAPPRARWPWAVAATVAAMVLAGQVLYRHRSELSTHFPVLKPALAQLCEWAQCSVPPLQLVTALNIEASDLQVADPARPQVVQLTATLRNRAGVEVGYPALDLVLTDNRDHALARRVIVPADYLPASGVRAAAATATIAANAEVIVRIDMDTSGLPAAGFRLTLTPAPID